MTPEFQPIPKPPKRRFPFGLLPVAVVASLGLHYGLLQLSVPEQAPELEEPESEPEEETLIIPITELKPPSLPPTLTPKSSPTPAASPSPSPTPKPSPAPQPKPSQVLPTPTPSPETPEEPKPEPDPSPTPSPSPSPSPSPIPSPTPSPSPPPDPPLEPSLIPSVNLTASNPNVTSGCLGPANNNCYTLPPGTGTRQFRNFVQSYKDAGYSTERRTDIRDDKFEDISSYLSIYEISGNGEQYYLYFLKYSELQNDGNLSTFNNDEAIVFLKIAQQEIEDLSELYAALKI